MRKITLCLPLLALAACNNVEAQRAAYLGTIKVADVSVGFANWYMRECLKQPKSDPCYTKRTEIARGIKLVEAARAQSKEVFAKGEEGFYDLSQTALENAVEQLSRATN